MGNNLLRFFKCLIEIGREVGDGFEADADADIIVGDAGLLEFLVGKLAVRGRSRVDDQRLCVAQVREVRSEFDRVDELFACRSTAFDAEPKDRAELVTEIFLGQLVARVARQAGVVDPGYRFVVFQKLGQG